MTRHMFELRSNVTVSGHNDLIKAFIQTNSDSPVIGCVSESQAGTVITAFGLRAPFGVKGILVTASLERDLGDGVVFVTVDQDNANFSFTPQLYTGD